MQKYVTQVNSADVLRDDLLEAQGLIRKYAVPPARAGPTGGSLARPPGLAAPLGQAWAVLCAGPFAPARLGRPMPPRQGRVCATFRRAE